MTGATLILQESAGVAPRRWDIGRGVTTIGRADSCDVVLVDREVSRQHAQIRHDADQYVVVDLGSKNGTWVNGVPATGAVRLVDGDEIRIAPRFCLLFADSDATVAASATTGRLTIDAHARAVRLGGRLLEPPLPPQQFALLQLLAADPKRVFSRDEIAAACYPDALGGVSDQAVDGVIRRLRVRLQAADPATAYLVAVRGHGFRLTR